MSLRIGSLFAGIGGLELGLERAGLGPTVWQVESDDYCRRVLAKHWPDATRYGDVREVDFTGVDGVDVLAGGFPCQPFSLAGRREGIADERWMWPEFARCVRALRPRYVVVENVPALLAARDAFGAVLADLAESGYDAEWDCVPAAAVGAPHLRDRLWLVAYPNSVKRRDEPQRKRWSVRASDPGDDGAARPVAHTNGEGQLQPGQLRRQERGWAGDGGGDVAHTDRVARWQGWPGDAAEGTRRRDADRGGVAADVADAERGRHPAELAGPVVFGGEAAGALVRYRQERGEPQWSAEPDVGRVANGVPARVDRLRTLGNAVVPQVAEFVGRRILEAERRESCDLGGGS